MSTSKTQVNASLNDQELELLAQAQEKYKSNGKGHASIRTFLMIGVELYLTNENIVV